MLLEEVRDSILLRWDQANNYALGVMVEKAAIAARATIIQRRYDSTKIFPQTLQQTVKCSDLIRVKQTECCNYDSGKAVVRTNSKVPKPLIVREDSHFTLVNSPEYQNISYIKPEDLDLIRYRRYSSSLPFYTYLNDYAYFFNVPSLKAANFRAVYENPLEVARFGECCDSGDCFDDDGKLVIEESLYEGISALVEQKRPLMLGKIGQEDTPINDEKV